MNGNANEKQHDRVAIEAVFYARTSGAERGIRLDRQSGNITTTAFFQIAARGMMDGVGALPEFIGCGCENGYMIRPSQSLAFLFLKNEP